MNNPTVIKLIQPINEAIDTRLSGKAGNTGVRDYGPNNNPNAYDWRLYSGSGYGKQLQAWLSGGNGYSYEVTDMGQYVVVRGVYHNLATGKTTTKDFVIVFDDPKTGDGKIFATSTKWRTVSNLNQAANYIKQTIQSFA